MPWLSSIAYPETYLRHCSWRVGATTLTSATLQWVDTRTFDWELVRSGSGTALVARAFDLKSKANGVPHYIAGRVDSSSFNAADLSIVARPQRALQLTQVAALTGAEQISLRVGEYALCTTSIFSDRCSDGTQLNHRRVQLVHTSRIAWNVTSVASAELHEVSAVACTWRVHRKQLASARADAAGVRQRKPPYISWDTVCAAQAKHRANIAGASRSAMDASDSERRRQRILAIVRHLSVVDVMSSSTAAVKPSNASHGEGAAAITSAAYSAMRSGAAELAVTLFAVDDFD